MTSRHSNTLSSPRYSSILSLKPLQTQLLTLSASIPLQHNQNFQSTGTQNGMVVWVNFQPWWGWKERHTYHISPFLVVLIHPYEAFCIASHHTTLEYSSESEYHIFHPFCAAGNLFQELFRKVLIIIIIIFSIICSLKICGDCKQLFLEVTRRSPFDLI